MTVALALLLLRCGKRVGGVVESAEGEGVGAQVRPT